MVDRVKFKKLRPFGGDTLAILSELSDDVLIALKDRFKTYTAMGNALGISGATICKEFKKRKIGVNKLIKVSDKELIKYRENGLTYEEIGEILKVSANTVSNEYKARGINIEIETSRLLSNVSNEELINLRLSGLSYSEIADKFKVSKSLINREFNIRNIKDGTINRKYKLVEIDNSLLASLRLDGNSYERIAEMLGVSVNTAHMEYKRRGLKD